jgi:hydrogenase-4 component E
VSLPAAFSPVDVVMVALVLTNLTLLGASRLPYAVRVVGAQGVLLGILPIVLHGSHGEARTFAFAACAIVLKGVVFPWLLLRALREAEVRREIEPFVGYSSSLLLGIAVLAVSLWLGAKLPAAGARTLLAPVALSTMLTGLQLLVTRRTVLTQVVGYLVFENGVFAFGVPLVRQAPFLVEMAVLLDVFVAVFVMGVAVFHIQRELRHLDADRLSTLKEWGEGPGPEGAR